jgi:hypothetical protein
MPGKGRPLAVATTRKVFLDSLRSAEALYDLFAPKCAMNQQNILGTPHPRQAQRIVAMSFLSIVSAWEEFLEGLVARYMAGAPYLTGAKPPLRIGSCTSLLHAYQVFEADHTYKPHKDYISWSDWFGFVKKARLFFVDGAPFSSLAANDQQRLADTSVLRNRIAHTSEKVREDFKKLITQTYMSATYQGYNAGVFLTSQAAHGFGPNAQDSYFKQFLALYRRAGDHLCPPAP